ncbi:helix-turn-helix domain-containing protein [Crossiella sp. SN42]|uniref:helix-turn-helix domain-containing protein n=1 Tax=Crossiella sp. SN42 TaxID=2944808 RepID=UPI00207C3B71|nr:helix-turn-helix transcriptional regulator [Crossiella sp. SN42]MCO1577101.1 helix-turn-helix domain-containing protein [Crossiella sp. SN42]
MAARTAQPGVGLPARLRHLCAELRALRKAQRWTLSQVATALGFSVTKVQRMETGRRGLKRDDVSALLTLYQVSSERRDRLLGLIATTGEPAWWQVPGVRLPEDWRQRVAFEDEATVIHDYEVGSVPALLQTAAYTRVLLATWYPRLSEADLTRMVAANLTRQLVLDRSEPPHLHCLIDESALLRPVGGASVLAQQLHLLREIAARPEVTLRVVPLMAGAHPGTRGSLTLMEFADGPAVARTAGAERLLDARSTVSQARQDWAAMTHAALSASATAALLDERATEAQQKAIDKLDAGMLSR